MYKAEFYVNVDAVLRASEFLGTSIRSASTIIEEEAFNFIKALLVDEFTAAGRIANSKGGFPEEYQAHLLENVGNIIPTVILDGRGLFVSIDLEDWLGGYDDLTKAYHRHAKLDGGGELTGPYDGQALKQEEAEIRHIYWQAMREGRAKADINGKHVPVQGNWDQTIEEYLQIWGDKSPQWLFIQFGQEEWEPYVTQVDIVNNLQDSINFAMSGYLASYLESVIRVANSFKSAGLEHGYTSKGQPRVIAGTVTVGGKTYRPGRFLPKGGL